MKRNVRVATGKLIIDTAVNDGTAIRGCADTDILQVTACYTTHGEHHVILLVHDLFSVFQNFAAQCSGNLMLAVTQK